MWHTLPDLTKRKVSLIFLVAYTMYVNRFSAFDRWKLGWLGRMTGNWERVWTLPPEMKRYFYRVKTYPWIVLTYFTSLKTIWWFRLWGLGELAVPQFRMNTNLQSVFKYGEFVESGRQVGATPFTTQNTLLLAAINNEGGRFSTTRMRCKSTYLLWRARQLRQYPFLDKNKLLLICLSALECWTVKAVPHSEWYINPTYLLDMEFFPKKMGKKI